MGNQVSKVSLRIGILLLSIVLCATMVTAEEKLMGKTVNINTATAEELTQVPMITPELAQAVVAYREEVAGFQLIEELILVEGFDQKLFLRVQSFFLIECATGECTD